MKQVLSARIIETPIGKMQGIASEKGLCALEFITPIRQKLLESRLSRWFSNRGLQHSENIFLDQAEVWLGHYFLRKFNNLSEIKTDLRGSSFETRVWSELSRITLGRTVTYAELAKRVGNPKASRAVGGASRRNPMSIIVPCHRVVGSNGDLTGYGGGLEQKHYLINHEKGSM